MHMNVIVQFVLQHGYAILFFAVFARQIGLPVPANLFLIAAGALAAYGKLDLVSVLGLATAASVLADWIWYEAGRQHGDKVLHFIHRFSQDPDAHDRRAKKTFARIGPPLLVFAKFVPGLDAVAPPLAGQTLTSRFRFSFEALGASLWASVYTGTGYCFSHDLNRAVAYAGRVATFFILLALAGLFIYIGRKMERRRALMRLFDAAPIDSPLLKGIEDGD